MSSRLLLICFTIAMVVGVRASYSYSDHDCFSYPKDCHKHLEIVNATTAPQGQSAILTVAKPYQGFVNKVKLTSNTFGIKAVVDFLALCEDCQPSPTATTVGDGACLIAFRVPTDFPLGPATVTIITTEVRERTQVLVTPPGFAGDLCDAQCSGAGNVCIDCTFFNTLCLKCQR